MACMSCLVSSRSTVFAKSFIVVYGISRVKKTYLHFIFGNQIHLLFAYYKKKGTNCYAREEADQYLCFLLHR